MRAETGRPKALLISPAFFGYERDIARELENQGFEVTFLDERPSNSAIVRAVIRARKELVGRFVESYFRRKQAELAATRFDLVMVIKAEAVPRWFLEDLRATSPAARFVFYTYDAIGNASNCLTVLDLFDRRLSFDSVDVAERQEFGYLPLFYSPEYSPLPLADAGTPRRFSLSFIGTLHSERYALVKLLFGNRTDTYGFFYVQARWYFALVKYVTREHARVPWREVAFTPLPRARIADVLRNSHAVVDIQRVGQSGLTMRTFEALASGAIVVTTNPAVTSEPFYDPARIVVVPATVGDLDADRVRAQLDSLPSPVAAPAGFERYSLESWVKQIIGSPPEPAETTQAAQPDS